MGLDKVETTRTLAQAEVKDLFNFLRRIQLLLVSPWRREKVIFRKIFETAGVAIRYTSSGLTEDLR